MLPKPFREFIELLEKNQVKYLVIGGYAVSCMVIRDIRVTSVLQIWK
jgi:hypothetical protein